MKEIEIRTQLETDEISLKDLISKVRDWNHYLMSKWVTILVLGLIGSGLGFIYANFKKPVYTATTTFVLEESDKGGGLGQYSGLASMVGVDVGGGSGGIFQGDNIIELYKSRKMIQKTLLTSVEYNGSKQLLVNYYISFNNLREKWSKNSELSHISFNLSSENSKFTRLQDSVLGKIVDDIDKNYLDVVKPDKKLSIIRTDVKAPDEFFAKNFNEQIVKNVNDFYVQTKIKKSLENVSILQQKTDSVRLVMNGSIYTAAAITDATPNLNPTRQLQRSAPVQRSQFSAETNKAMLIELVRNLELSKISLRKEAPLIQVVDEPLYPLDKVVFSKLKGVVLGGVFMVIITVLVLVIRRLFK